MSVVTVHMVYFCAFARSEIFLENARKSGVGRGQFDAGVNGLNNFKNEKIHSICIFCYNLKVYCNLPRMHTHNDIPSTACHFQWFLYTRISQAHISFRFAVVCKPLRVFYLYQKPIGF